MSLSLQLLALVPDIDMERDVLIQDDGNGPYIKQWHLQRPQPSQNALNAVTEAQIRAAKARKNAARMSPRESALIDVLVDELNVLRVEAGLDAITRQDIDDAVQTKMEG